MYYGIKTDLRTLYADTYNIMNLLVTLACPNTRAEADVPSSAT